MGYSGLSVIIGQRTGLTRLWSHRAESPESAGPRYANSNGHARNSTRTVVAALGFVKEGRHRKESVVDGKRENTFTYDILADEDSTSDGTCVTSTHTGRRDIPLVLRSRGMPGPAFASGDSVSLHPIEDEDREFLQYGHNHPDIRRPLGSSTIRSRGDIAELVEDDEYRFLVCVDECSESPERAHGEAASSVAERSVSAGDASHGNLEPVGVVALPWVFEDTQSAFLMYWIAPRNQGNGYATEATELLLNYVFRECGFHKVAAYVHETNDASAAVLESLGFQREGTLRQEVFTDGEWLDEHRYAVLADEWLE